MTKDLLCPIPWEMAAVKGNGDFRVCCHANVSKGRGLIQNGEKVLNCGRNEFSEMRNADTLKEVRVEMLKGNWHEFCGRCKVEEDSGIKSRRQKELELSANNFSKEKALQWTKEDGEIDPSEFPLTRIDLRLGNKCNLKCRMCGPTDSDAWYSDHVSLWNVKSFEDTHGTVKLNLKNGRWHTKDSDYDWVDDSFFWNSFEQIISNLEYIHLVGGEPLLIDNHMKVLEKCIELDYAKGITLEYNTNLTVMPDQFLETWSHFKEVKIGISLDGVGEVNDYIRYPSKFSHIEENIKKLSEYTKGNFTIWVSFTFQILNALSFKDFVLWKVKSEFYKPRGYFHKSVVSSHALHGPEFLSVQALPEKLKESFFQRLQKDIKDLKTELTEIELKPEEIDHIVDKFKEAIHGYFEYMVKEDKSEHFPELIRHIQKLDQIRGQSVKDSLPEFFGALEAYLKD